MLEKVISGGQSGVDRAALDAAMGAGITVGGWCPRGRKALDGVIPAKYPLQETRDKSYKTRTKWNVRDADATLILCRDEPTGGTALTIKQCEALDKPYYLYQLQGNNSTYVDGPENPYDLLYWFNSHQIRTLNVAGPREGRHCPIYTHAYGFLKELFSLLQNGSDVCEPQPCYSIETQETAQMLKSLPTFSQGSSESIETQALIRY